MTETVAIKDLTPAELEPALRRALGIRAYLSGIGRLGRNPVVQAGSVRIELIDDDKSGERTVIFTKVPDVISLELDRRSGGGYILRVPTEDTHKLLEDRYRGYISRHESEVLKHSYRQLIQISEVDLAMRPIADILIRVHEYGLYTPRLGRSAAARTRRVRTARYAQLLADLRFIQREGSGYVPGPMLPRDFAPDTPPEEIYAEFLGQVLQASHQFLTDVLHLTMIKPFLRIENSYYWPAHRAGAKLRIRRERLANIYSGYYVQRPLKFETHLQSLIRKDALASENGNIVGSDDILSPLLRQDFESWMVETALPGPS